MPVSDGNLKRCLFVVGAPRGKGKGFDGSQVSVPCCFVPAQMISYATFVAEGDGTTLTIPGNPFS